MDRIMPVKVVYHHSGGEKQKERFSIRYVWSDFPNTKSLKKYVKNVLLNNYLPASTARKIEVYIAENGDGVANSLKWKAKKVEVVEQIVVDVYW
jgi:hypothetical protein